MEHLEPVTEAREAVTSVVSSAYNLTLNSIFMALALTVALAWFAVVKEGVRINWPGKQKDGVWALLGFAVIITLLFAVAVWLSKRFLGKDLPDRRVVYAIAPSM